MKQITEKQVDDITNMICSDVKTEKKALELYAFFDEYNIVNSVESYSKLDPIILRRFIKIKNIYEHFEKNKLFTKVLDGYNFTIVELAEKLKRLNAAWEIMNSDKDEFEMYEEMKKIYKKSTALKNDFSYIIKQGIDDNLYDMARDALNNFDSIVAKYESFEKGNNAKKLETLSSDKKHSENYEYAKSIITYYIESPDSYTDSIFFFARLNINKHTFDRCLKLIEKKDPELHERYLVKVSEDDKIRDEKYREIITDLANGIETGELADGTKFDKLEFIKRIPFKSASPGCFVKDLRDFLSNMDIQVETTILNYVYDNEMNARHYFRRLYISYFYHLNTVIDGRKITDEDNDLIFDYLYLNNIPSIFTTYKLVRKKLVDGEIKKETIKEQKEKQNPLVKKVLRMELQ